MSSRRRGDVRSQVWDTATGDPLGEPLQLSPGQVSTQEFSPDGRFVLTASSRPDGTRSQVWVRETDTGRPIADPIEHQGVVLTAAFSPDGKMIVTAGTERTARLWDVLHRRFIGEPLRHEDKVSAVTFSPDGRIVATGSNDPAVQG